ncbi:MAG: fatty acid desaturase [Verrucomicrobiota bacterium]
MSQESDPSIPASSPPPPRATSWKTLVADYQKPSAKLATWQLVNTLGPYALVWILLFFSLSISWLLTIPLAALAGGLLVRIFIIFHDCGHGSFFPSKRANDFWGFITGLLSFTPYHHWKWEHSVHHATTGHLDRRGIGDIWTMTVEEYLGASSWKRFTYRLARNPLVLFVIAPLFIFLVQHRFALPKANARAKRSVWITNLALGAMAVGLSLWFGFLPWLLIQLAVLAVAGSIGVWLFYVQHQFEDAYWEHAKEWNHFDASMKGSSYYQLPKVLQWFTGNIGFHHLHHLSSRIPNYHLERCHFSDPMFQEVEPLTMWASLKTISYRLWDEESKKLITFGQLKKGIRSGTIGAAPKGQESWEEVVLPGSKVASART